MRPPLSATRGSSEALAADPPVVVESDPEVPPLAPHITLQQAKAFAEVLVKGDPEEGNVVLGAAHQVLASILPEKVDTQFAGGPLLGRLRLPALLLWGEPRQPQTQERSDVSLLGAHALRAARSAE